MNEYIEAITALDKNSVILTPNRRLAATLHALYQHEQCERGNVCWESPAILPINVWLDELWNSHASQTFAALPHILTAVQEQQLWESILSDSNYHAYLLQVSETARLVKAARGLLKQWLIDTSHPLFNTADDYTALQRWISVFEKTCHEKNWCDQACLPDMIREQISAGTIAAPQVIYHAGFTDLSPQQTALFTAAEQRGSKLVPISLTQPAKHIHRTSAADSDEEIRLCALWAMQQHHQHPQQTLGCVFPMLDQKRSRVTQIFTEIFGHPDHFNISAGRPLSHYPVLHAALELLALFKKNISSDSFFFILSTPFIGGAEKERIKRSHFDSKLRAKNFNAIELAPQLIKNEDHKILNLARSCPALARRISAFKVLLDDTKQTAAYAYWAPVINQLLSALGWPGERVLNSEEYQVVDEWLKLLHELTTLDLTAQPVTFYEALQTLKGLAAVKPFQPKTPAANVQILGVLEAAGLQFDQLWISGMDDTGWPSQPKPNPFIPKQLQRELNMPHASAERELAYCQSMTRQFKHSASNVIFSYARTLDDNLTQPSPLIRDLPEMHGLEIMPAVSQKIFSQRALEKMTDETAPVQMPDEKVSGGIKIIENQAQCPFKAFAECRLGARELESPLPGIRAKERGTIVHQILERCWKQLQTQDNLLATSDDALHVLLEGWINEAIHDHAQSQSQQNSYLTLEKQRLHQLIYDWLQIEKQRSPFAVASSETQADIALGQLKLSVRIDRIDQLADGNHLIIDYKTGSNLSPSDWFGDRLDAPQLPLYAQIDSEHTAGIAYAQVNSVKHRFIGVSRYELEINGVTPTDNLRAPNKKDWQTLNMEWQHALNKLGNDFYHGKASVDPKDPKTTCVYCSLKPLCRVYEYNGYANEE